MGNISQSDNIAPNLKMVFREIEGRLTSIENTLATRTPKEEPKLKYLSREEVAEILKVTLPTLNTYTRQGIIKSHKIGSQVLYLESDITEALKDNTPLRYRRR